METISSVCVFCNKVCKNKRGLEIHKANCSLAHGINSARCTYCKQEFYTRSYLQTHLTTCKEYAFHKLKEQTEKDKRDLIDKYTEVATTILKHPSTSSNTTLTNNAQEYLFDVLKTELEYLKNKVKVQEEEKKTIAQKYESTIVALQTQLEEKNDKLISMSEQFKQQRDNSNYFNIEYEEILKEFYNKTNNTFSNIEQIARSIINKLEQSKLETVKTIAHSLAPNSAEHIISENDIRTNSIEFFAILKNIVLTDDTQQSSESIWRNELFEKSCKTIPIRPADYVDTDIDSNSIILDTPKNIISYMLERGLNDSAYLSDLGRKTVTWQDEDGREIKDSRGYMIAYKIIDILLPLFHKLLNISSEYINKYPAHSIDKKTNKYIRLHTERIEFISSVVKKEEFVVKQIKNELLKHIRVKDCSSDSSVKITFHNVIKNIKKTLFDNIHIWVNKSPKEIGVLIRKENKLYITKCSSIYDNNFYCYVTDDKSIKRLFNKTNLLNLINYCICKVITPANATLFSRLCINIYKLNNEDLVKSNIEWLSNGCVDEDYNSSFLQGICTPPL